MKTFNRMRRLTVGVLAAALLALAIGAMGGAMGEARAQSAVPFPVIPQAQGGECVDDPEVMRRTHMHRLNVHRDATMREGVRFPSDSFTDCIACHTVNDPATGQAISHTDSRHFCTACHEYAAVRVDCFACHASVPEVAPLPVSLPQPEPEPEPEPESEPEAEAEAAPDQEETGEASQ